MEINNQLLDVQFQQLWSQSFCWFGGGEKPREAYYTDRGHYGAFNCINTNPAVAYKVQGSLLRLLCLKKKKAYIAGKLQSIKSIQVKGEVWCTSGVMRSWQKINTKKIDRRKEELCIKSKKTKGDFHATMKKGHRPHVWIHVVYNFWRLETNG